MDKKKATFKTMLKDKNKTQSNDKKKDKRKVLKKDENAVTKKNVSKKANPNSFNEWLLMLKEEVNAKMIYDILLTKDYQGVEVWEEFNILEIDLEETTMDFEPIQFRAKSDLEFAEKNHIKTIFALTLRDGLNQKEGSILSHILEQYEGFICLDNENFAPILYKLDLPK